MRIARLQLSAVEQDVPLRSRLPVIGDENDRAPFDEQHQGRFFNLTRMIPETQVKKVTGIYLFNVYRHAFYNLSQAARYYP